METEITKTGFSASPIEITAKIMKLHENKLKPLCKAAGLPRTAVDILMFLANNPACNSARDIVEIRKIPANLVSVNVERLVQDGYILRKAAEHDRRKTILVLTDKAQPLTKQGRELQREFAEELFAGVSDSQKQVLMEIAGIIEKNLQQSEC